MFNYIKETIINDQNNVIKDSNDILVVKRGGNYDCAKICDGKVYKTVGNVGTAGTITIDPSKFTNNNDIDYRQFAVFIGASEKLADYALANWAEFGKPILIESVATDSDKLAEAFKLALPNDNPLYKVTVSSSKVILTLAESWMIPVECTVFEHYATTDKLEKNTTSDLVTIVKNVPEFATGKWLVENLRFPSYPNRRYAALYSDEAPVKGTVYTQYAFQYIVKHSVPGGLSAVGQHVDSITTHVFYVPNADASTFEDKFTGVSFVTTPGEVASMDPSSVSTAAATASAAASGLSDLKGAITDEGVTDIASLQSAVSALDE